MRLRQIEIFYHVYREGSISGAARTLHVSQPSVSKVLRYAEDQLGFELFKRTKGKLVPTPAADELYLDVREIYDQVGALNRSASNIRNRKGGHIRLGVLPSLSLTAVPESIARLRKSNPALSFEITTLHSSEMNAALLERKCDICIGFGTEEDERLVSQNLIEVPLMLIAQSEELQSEAGTVDLSVLHEADFVSMKDSGPAAEILDEKLKSLGIQPNEVVAVHTYYVATALVRLGVGLAITDQFTANSFMAENLEKFSLSPPLSLPVCATSHTENRQRELLDACLLEMTSVFQSG